MNSASKRRLILATALVFALGSAIMAPSEEMAPAAAKRNAAPRAATGAAAPSLRDKNGPLPALVPYERTQDKGLVADLFEPRPAPVAAAAAKPAPVAPPVPFAYMGSLQDGAKLKVYIARGETLIETAVGENFAPDYRLDAAASDGLTITYLPMNAQQRVPAPAQ